MFFSTIFPASLAVEAGVAGIIVSNHGARQLDYVPATITALEEVVKAAQGRVPVFLDGGIRRGTDVFKALALGASGVFVSMKKRKKNAVAFYVCCGVFLAETRFFGCPWQIGRPVVFALAAAGEAGVRKAVEMLRDEFELTMALSGCRSIEEITRAHVIAPWDSQSPRVAPRL